MEIKDAITAKIKLISDIKNLLETYETENEGVIVESVYLIRNTVQDGTGRKISMIQGIDVTTKI